MQISIERKPHMYKSWFGLGKYKQWGDDIVIEARLTEVEKEIIKRAKLGNHIIWEDPRDLANYQDQLGSAAIRRSKMSAVGAMFSEMTTADPPRYVKTRFTQHFLENPIQTIHPFEQDAFVMMTVERQIKENFTKLKNLTDAVLNHTEQQQAHPKQTFEL